MAFGLSWDGLDHGDGVDEFFVRAEEGLAYTVGLSVEN